MEEARKEFMRQWAVDGMPKDKQRLAEAAWKAACIACAEFVKTCGAYTDWNEDAVFCAQSIIDAS